jgi:hypothetical protein
MRSEELIQHAQVVLANDHIGPWKLQSRTEWQRPLGEGASACHLSSERTGDIRRKSHHPAIELSKHF